MIQGAAFGQVLDAALQGAEYLDRNIHEHGADRGAYTSTGFDLQRNNKATLLGGLLGPAFYVPGLREGMTVLFAGQVGWSAAQNISKGNYWTAGVEGVALFLLVRGAGGKHATPNEELVIDPARSRLPDWLSPGRAKEDVLLPEEALRPNESRSPEEAMRESLAKKCQEDGQCFAGEVLIATADGAKRMDELREGDRVWTRPENDPGALPVLSVVEAVFVRVGPVVNLHVEGQILRTTAGHPFYVQHRGWRATYELEIGEKILTRSGDWVEVEGVADSGEVITVYNGRIAEHHTYFVKAGVAGSWLWSHNMWCPLDKLSREELLQQLRETTGKVKGLNEKGWTGDLTEEQTQDLRYQLAKEQALKDALARRPAPETDPATNPATNGNKPLTPDETQAYADAYAKAVRDNGGKTPPGVWDTIANGRRFTQNQKAAIRDFLRDPANRDAYEDVLPKARNRNGKPGNADHDATVDVVLRDLAAQEFPNDIIHDRGNIKHQPGAARGLSVEPDIWVEDLTTQEVKKAYEAVRTEADGKTPKARELRKAAKYKARGIDFKLEPVRPIP
jgi:hypothetical protein